MTRNRLANRQRIQTWIPHAYRSGVDEKTSHGMSGGVVEEVRLTIYTQLAETGSAPNVSEIAAGLAQPTGAVEAAFDDLAAKRHIVLDERRRILLAHPFATVNLGFSVMGAETLWWGGCVWDSFAIPHLVPSDDEVVVATTCPNCGRAHAWVVTIDGPPRGDQIAHFLVPMADAWTDVLRTCGHQRVFCDRQCLDRWLGEHGLTAGYVSDLSTVWRLASQWYEGRLDSPYIRREPAEALQYFRSVGLEGPFWGID